MSRKDVYYQKMEAQLREWNAELEKLKAKMDKLDAEVTEEYYQSYENLLNRRDELADKFVALRETSDDVWDDLKHNIDRTVDDLNSGFERFKKLF